jgi:hypothetical protein
MSRPLVHWLSAASIAVAAPAFAQQGVTADNITAAADPKSNDRVILIDWREKSRNDYDYRRKVTPKNAVSVLVTHFNFIRYDIVWSVDAKEVPGYRFIEGQWGDLLSLSAVPQLQLAGTVNLPEYLVQLQQWRDNIDHAALALAASVKAVPLDLALTDDQIKPILDGAQSLDSTIKALAAQRDTVKRLILQQFSRTGTTASSQPAQNSKETTPQPPTPAPAPNGLAAKPPMGDALADKKKPATQEKPKPQTAPATTTYSNSPVEEAYYAQQLYDSETKRYQAVVDKLQSFIELSTDVQNGRTKDLDGQKSGTIVTVTLRPKPLTASGDEAKRGSVAGATTVRYFVQSPLPLSFHFGPAYTNLKTFDIEKVQRPNQGDLFQQTSKPAGGGDLLALMTFMLTPMDIAGYDAGLGPTIGTGVKDIGKRIYLGGTAKFNDRLFITVGKFSETVKEGDAANAAGNNLFTTIRNVRKWGWFGALSVLPF